ncbi:MAG TPA: hypothetical protein IAB11_06845 [Candidatus Ornithoclostridium faecavium]|nr:hypothetical protein [Candidatus Ornithoclostridium faecavium]
MSLIKGITIEEIKKIFSNNRIKRNYLEILSNSITIDVKNLHTDDLDNVIVGTWEYHKSKQIIRDLFLASEKYENNRNSGSKITALMDEWDEMRLGKFDWPFKPKMFDQYVHSINRRPLTEKEKDEAVAIDAIKYRRIKDINAQRNDYIEYLIFKNNDNIIPTFTNKRGVDFYINGEPFDQKVSRSVGKNFIDEYGEDYREIAIQRPDLVAKCLYKYQDEERFGFEPRLLIVYLDSDLEIEDIENSLVEVNFNNPINLEFDYRHSDGRIITYKTYCYIVLVHK